MANKTIDALVFCPFYMSEAKTTITCEGIIGDYTVSRFHSEKEKADHEKNFCTGVFCKGCSIHAAIMQNYSHGANTKTAGTLRC